MDCIRILAEVRKNVPAHLLMVGDGPDRSPAEHLARDLKVDRHVLVPGQAESRGATVPAGARAADAERNGVASDWRRWRLWPAGCCRWPRGSGGVPELITHGEDGFLEPVGDIAGAGRTRGRPC